MTGTFPTAKISLFRKSDVRKTTPLTKVIESFFISTSGKPRTKDFYRTHLVAYTKFVSDNTGREPLLSDLNADYVNQYLRDLETRPTIAYPKGSPFRARAAGTTLKRLGNWLAKEDIFKESPLRKVKKTKELKDVRQPLSNEELEQVIDAAGESGDRFHALIAFMAGTGLRLNEARELRISDLHLRECEVVIRAETCKVGVARTVVFHEDIAQELDRYLRKRDDARGEDPLFPTDEGHPYTDGGFGKIFQRLAKESGVRRFHAHLLRHTWATNFMRGDGADLLSLKRQGGWSRMDMVERYSHAIPIKNRAALPNPLGQRKLLRFDPKRRAVQ